MNTVHSSGTVDLMRIEGKLLVSSSPQKAALNRPTEKEGIQETGAAWRRRAVGQRNRTWAVDPYILKDDGASESFVSRDYLDKLKQKGADIETRDEGFMIVRTARHKNEPPPKERRQRAKLRIQLGGSYTYNAWFTVFDVDTYDIILGKRWVRDINQR